MKLREMYTNEELKKGVRNPFFHQFGRKVEVAVLNEDYKVFEEVAKMNGETPESVMKRCLQIAAKDLKEQA